MLRTALLLALLPNAASAADIRGFTNARIIDGTGNVIETGVLVVQDGRIVRLDGQIEFPPPRGAEVINAAGKTIIPGLINAHGHVADVQGLRSSPDFYTPENVARQLGLYARYGVTTVFSLGGDGPPAFRMRDEQNTPALKRARIYVAGPVLTSATPEAARKDVDAVAAMKADVVKIRLDDNLGASKKMPPEVYTAVIQEAKLKGMRTIVHVFYLDDAKAVLKLGGEITHSVRDRDVDDEFIALLKKSGSAYCPTLMREVSTFVYESTPDFFADPFFLREVDPQVVAQLKDPKRQQAMHESVAAQKYKAGLQIANRNLKKVRDAGIPIVMGTDTGPAARFQGYFEHLELERMVEAGMTPMQVLVSATGAAAKYMKLAGQVGTLQKGAWADLLVLGKNPLEDIRNTQSLESVWIAGNRL
jgi:imidazolonepropionase-like amidohydrolase